MHLKSEDPTPPSATEKFPDYCSTLHVVSVAVEVATYYVCFQKLECIRFQIQHDSTSITSWAISWYEYKNNSAWNWRKQEWDRWRPVSGTQLVQQLEHKYDAVHLLHICPLFSKRNSPLLAKQKPEAGKEIFSLHISVCRHIASIMFRSFWYPWHLA